MAQLCQGTIGAVFCLEASRLARNGHDWHHLLELCGLVGARVIDVEGAYDPSHPNDRLLLGLKGTMSEFELTLLRRRLVDGARQKAQRGELRLPVPTGYRWEHGAEPVLDPDRRVQDAIRRVFRLFERLGSARQVHRYLCDRDILFPRPADGKHQDATRWAIPGYRNIISVLRNPFYAGAYAYGKSEVRTTVVQGRARKSYGHDRPMDQWTVLLQEHHEGYVDWTTFERNQHKLATNTFCRKAGGAKSGRGGRALLSGLLRCRRCGRMLQVAYAGRGQLLVRYACRTGQAMHGLAKCISFGGIRPDERVARLLFDAVQPMAIEAALMADKQVQQMHDEQRRALELQVEQARYETLLAQRRYESVDPDNRLVAAELEERWNHALKRLQQSEAQLEQRLPDAPAVDSQALTDLAQDLERAWHAPSTDMRTRQRLVRALIEEIVVDVDDSTREVVLLIHWKGGEHSEHRVRKPGTGEHRRRAPEEADAVIRQMAGRWSDEHVAASLNRLGFKTGQDNTWTAMRVGAYRRKKQIRGYTSAHKDGRCLTMQEAAQSVGVSSYAIRKLIRSKILPARQVMKDAPWQILAIDLARPDVQAALTAHRSGRNRPCRSHRDDQTLRIPGT